MDRTGWALVLAVLNRCVLLPVSQFFFDEMVPRISSGTIMTVASRRGRPLL